VKPTSKSKQKGRTKKAHVAKAPSQAEVKAAVKQANERFARLGLVSGILRGPSRSRYDHFLKNGFPRWRGTGYYYSRFRPGLGSVLVGLFILGGGAAHYGILRLSWRRQRDFVGRYIREARRAAWGDEIGIKGVPGAGDSTVSHIPPAPQDDMGMQGLNRRQRRAQEKGGKKGKGVVDGGNASGAESAGRDNSRGGERKKVVAENGKVLIVDASGNVFLVEENENGEAEEFLLDVGLPISKRGIHLLTNSYYLKVDEIPKPTMKQTILFRVPIWIFGKIMSPFQKKDYLITDSESSEIDGDEATPKTSNGQARRIKKGARGG
jgi:hypothetical protein